MLNCYKIEKLSRETSLFSPDAISATYVLTMENSTRPFKERLDEADMGFVQEVGVGGVQDERRKTDCEDQSDKNGC